MSPVLALEPSKVRVQDNATFSISGTVTLQQVTLHNMQIGTVAWDPPFMGQFKFNAATLLNEGEFVVANGAGGSIVNIGPAGGPASVFRTQQWGKVQVQPAAIAQIDIPFHASGQGFVKVDNAGLTLGAGGSIATRIQTPNNGLVVFGGGAFSWNAGTVFEGNSQIKVRNSQVTIANGLTVAPWSLTLADGGEIGGPGNMQVVCIFNWEEGSLTGTGITTLSGETIIGGEFADNPSLVLKRTLNNFGWITLAGPTDPAGPVTLFVSDGGSINNSGTFRIADDSDVMQSVENTTVPELTNSGLVEKTGGAGTSTIDLKYKNEGGTTRRSSGKLKIDEKLIMMNGTFDAGGGPVELAGDFQQSGGDVLVQNGASFTHLGNAAMSGGTIQIDGESVFASTDAQTTFAQTGGSISLLDPESLLSLAGAFAISGGTVLIDNEAEMTVASMTQRGGTVTLGASLSDLTVSGSLQQTGGLLNASYLGAHITVTGSVTVGSGATLLLQFGGQIIAGGGVTLQSGGILNAYLGEVIGNLVNGGTINLDLDGVPYTLYVDGNYTQTGTGTLNITLTDDSTTARLKVTGTATLGGTLNVALDGVSPSDGSSYMLLEAGAISDEFDTHNPPPLGSGQWVWQYQEGDPFDTLSLWRFE